MNKKHIYLILFLILIGCNKNDNTEKSINQPYDSIPLWIDLSKTTTLPLIERKKNLDKAYKILKSGKIDTSSTRQLSNIAYQYLNLKDTQRFKSLNKETYKLALSIKDTFTLADVNWSEANYYKKIEQYDSAYYYYNKAYRYFEKIDHQNEAAKMLYGMAFIKGRYEDYFGSEILIIKAISKYKSLNELEALYASYNHLALLQSDINEYSKALFYSNKALEYLNKLENDRDLYTVSYNNIGTVYQKQKKYKKALFFYDKALKSDDSLYVKNIELYATLIDNKAFCKLMIKDTVAVKTMLYKALKIRDSTNNKGGQIMSNIHLSKYYTLTGDFTKAIFYIKKSNVLAKKIKYSRDYLESLQILSTLDSKNGIYYLKEHIKYSDSLKNHNRMTQNKFTRIEYETNEYVKENKILSQQNLQIIIIALITLLIVSLIYYIIIQKFTNEKLLLETEQQKANEQVYVLTLKQKDKLEKEKRNERSRISQELHDGILGKLFGLRIGLGFLNIEGSEEMLGKHESFLNELQVIESEIRDVSHKLTFELDNSEVNFSYIIKELLEEKSLIGNFYFELNIEDNITWIEINKSININLYRVLQEALHNIVKYSRAKNVTLCFSIDTNNLIIHLNDDGVGFDISKTKSGIGIKNMKNRITNLKGSFNINSEINKGTTLSCIIPIN
jgi:two-component system NarL family sensor kinase